MLRFFRQFRYRLMNRNPSEKTSRPGRYSKYLFYVIGEIIIVIIGILLALQVDTWNTERRDRAEALRGELRARAERGDDAERKSKNGMTDAASPIIIEGQHVANAFVGQFLLHTPDKEYFRQQAVKFGFNKQDYLNALNEVAIISEKKVFPIMDFLTSYAETVATMGLDKIRRKEYQEELLHHRENLEEMVKERTAELRASEEKSRLLSSSRQAKSPFSR